MMKKLYLIVGLLSCWISSPAQERGSLLADTLIEVLDREALLEVYADFGLPESFFPIEYDVALYKIVYSTPGVPFDSLSQASALVAIPLGASCTFPLLTYNHGIFTYDLSISSQNALFNQDKIGHTFAANGYVTLSPDYLGYGETPKEILHPFLVTEYEAATVIDGIRATRQLCEAIPVALNGQLFLTGYSQGGRVAMSTHKVIEETWVEEMPVTASAPLSGAYDLSGIIRDSVLTSPTYSHPIFLAFAFTAYQYLYGDLYDSLQQVFIPPYDTYVEKVFNRENPQRAFLDSMTYPGAYEMMQPDYYEAVLTDSLHPLNVALRKNDIYEWAPEAPMNIVYCASDDQNPFANSEFTRDRMISLGAENVTSINIELDLNHLECAFPAIINAKAFFDEFREPCSEPTGIATSIHESLDLFPNPFQESFTFSQLSAPLPYSQAILRDMTGRMLQSWKLTGPQENLQVNRALPSGTYLLQVTGNQGSTTLLVVKQG